ncbi:MAG: hypothetical protein FRX48_01117 [Lasallia pustulata]|uniref:BTB/POZ-like n=1 Tax=Lasallia pustulata TaxID=136370 RepID=A0A1W5DA40_9LECA|nr:MAG: hypothetical protein FRX48_01117 [Lasallia pustulata]SLM39739.1 BTB/POZ-like [Lasallia pustulata]
MFKRSFHSKDRAGKAVKPVKKSYREHTKMKLQQKLDSPPVGSSLTSPIITLIVGREQRLFAAHEDVLSLSPFFTAALKGQFLESTAKKVELPDEEPEIFSCVLEYLYKGDYYPRLQYNKRLHTWELEDTPTPQDSSPHHKPRGHHAPPPSTIHHPGVGGTVLKDTVIYCTADKFGLDELKRLALRKQGLQSSISVETILRSARFAYEHTPETDSKLRGAFLALIIRSRKIFKRSGTMQMEMEIGGSKLFFDLFCAMANHLEDVIEITNSRSPKSI